MLGLSVLYRSKRFDYIVSGINRGDNLGLHVVYSGTVAGAREGAMRTGAVGVAVSLDSYSRTADYSEAARLTAELVTSIHDAPGLTETLRGCVLNVNVPNLPRERIEGVKLTTPGLSCTQSEWVRVPGTRDAEDDETRGPDSDSDGDWRHDGAFADGVECECECPDVLGGVAFAAAQEIGALALALEAVGEGGCEAELL